MSVSQEFLSKLRADAAEQTEEGSRFWFAMQLMPLDLTRGTDDRPSLLQVCQYLQVVPEVDAGSIEKGIVVELLADRLCSQEGLSGAFVCLWFWCEFVGFCWIQVLLDSMFPGFKFCWIRVLLCSACDSFKVFTCVMYAFLHVSGMHFCWIQLLLDSTFVLLDSIFFPGFILFAGFKFCRNQLLLNSSFAGCNIFADWIQLLLVLTICWMQFLLGSTFAGFKCCWVQLFAGFNFMLDSSLLDSRFAGVVGFLNFAGFNFCWIQDLLHLIMSLRWRLMGFPGAECLPRVYSDVRV